MQVLPAGRLQLHADQLTGSIHHCLGLLAGWTRHRATLEELNQAAAAGWAGDGGRRCRSSALASGGDFADGVIAFGGRQLGSERFATFDRAAAQLLTDAGESLQLL
jgi:hypothetical protein